jgi:hypothetical protein
VKKYSCFSILSDAKQPDRFSHSANDEKYIKLPSDDFVLCRDSLGEVTARYSDEEWDFSPYTSIGSYPVKLILPDSLYSCCDIKWILFLHIYYSDSSRCGHMTTNSLRSKCYFLKKVSYYSERVGRSIIDVLSTEKDVIGLLDYIKNDRGNLLHFKAVTSFLSRLGEQVARFRVLISSNILNVITVYQSALKENKQTAIIPPRIYLSLIGKFDSFLKGYADNSSGIKDLISIVAENCCYARGIPSQKRIVISRTGGKRRWSLNFEEAAEVHGLKKYFDLYKVYNLATLKGHLSRVQNAARVCVHAYSGMRDAEVKSLRHGCLTQTGGVYRISGITTKMLGVEKTATWITSKAVCLAIESLESIVDMVAFFSSEVSTDRSDYPLFITLQYMIFSKDKLFKKPPNGYSISTIKITGFKHLDESRVVIEEEDFKELERIDPFRDWQALEEFSPGSLWPISSHQFRRSLVVYMAQSGIVSLTSLKYQLKHLTKDMVIYYLWGSSRASPLSIDNGIALEINDIKPRMDALAYIHDVLLNEEDLIGGHGIWLKNNVKDRKSINIIENFDEIESQIKSGMLAYSETPLGGCSTSEPCNKKLLRAVSACVSCSRASIVPSKLDKVIFSQEQLLSTLDKNTVEFRFESGQLSDLLRLKGE